MKLVEFARERRAHHEKVRLTADGHGLMMEACSEEVLYR